MTPNSFFNSFVEGNYYDFVENPGCVRRAFNAAVSASHLADHYFEFNRKNDPEKIWGLESIGAFVEVISAKTSGAFRDIRSIANAYKHLYTGTSPRYAVHSSVASTGAIECIQFSYPRVGVESLEEQFELGNEATKVVYRRKDGQGLDFLPALEAVHEYWRDLLYRVQA